MNDHNQDPIAAWIIAGVLTLAIVLFSALPSTATRSVPVAIDVGIPGIEAGLPARDAQRGDAVAEMEPFDLPDDDEQLAEVPPRPASAEAAHKSVKEPPC